MGNLFEYSKFVENQDFIGRKEEIERLSANFVFLTNTILLAPQGWGKSSLLRKAAAAAAIKDKSLRFCHIKLSNVRDEERFYELLAQGVIQAVSSTVEEAVSYLSRFFTNPSPRLEFNNSSVEGIRLNYDWSDIRRSKESIMSLPSRIAQDIGLKLVVCIDDFHSVEQFPETDSFLQFLKSQWTNQKNVSYCLAAQENQTVVSFAKTAVPFSRYGDIIQLGRIKPVAFTRHLRDRFAESGKYLDGEVASLIVDLVEGHPFYVQQLAHISWMNTSVVCSREVVMEAHETIVNQMQMMFDIITSALTTQQLCYLHAVLAGETVISTSEVLHRHHITSATSASRSKAALLQKGLVCNQDGKITMIDPIYSYWLTNKYFK